METDAPDPQADRLDQIERLLAERGHELASGRLRVAIGRSGVAVGFPDVPLIHVAWWALTPLMLLAGVRLRRRARAIA